MRNRVTGLAMATTLAGLLAIGPGLASPASATDRSVVVRPGDTLTAIARRHGTSVEQIAALNHLPDANRIYVGQRLTLVASTRTPAAATSTASGSIHVVRPGEHLTGIALRYGTTVEALVAANAVPNPSLIRVGQRLVIPSDAKQSAPLKSVAPAPPAPPAAAPATPTTPATHRVLPGETLTSIARHYATTIPALVQANAIRNPSYVRAGDVLRIPGGVASPPAAAVRPTASMSALMDQRAAVRTVIVAEARRFDVPSSLALAVAWQESGWRQGVVSSAGAIGVMQLLPDTADWVGATMLGRDVDPRDMTQNVRAGVRLLAHYLGRYHGDRSKALAAYYQGQRAVDEHGIFNVSRPYIASVLALEARLRQ